MKNLRPASCNRPLTMPCEAKRNFYNLGNIGFEFFSIEALIEIPTSFDI